MERTTWYADPDKMDRDPSGESTPIEHTEGKQANLVSSLLENGMHAPTLDVDLPCWVVPSTTPGHCHLYIDVELTWEEYQELLKALVKARIVGRGYAQHSVNRGKTVVRMPWLVKKVQPKPDDEEPF